MRPRHEWEHYFSDSTAKWRRAHLKNYILPAFGNRYLSTITKKEVWNWLSSIKRLKQTRNHILFTFRIPLRETEEQELILFNPLEKVRHFVTKNKLVRDIFTSEDLKLLFPPSTSKLFAVWKNAKYASLFLIFATKGIRSGEARAVQWKHVLDNGWLIIEQAVKSNGTIADTKTRSDRLVFLPLRTHEALDLWRAESIFTEPEDFIFFGADRNRPMNVTTASKLLPKAIDRAGIERNGRNLVVHSFRHTFTTMMRRILPEDILRQFTGHKTLKMTELYDHPAIQDKMSKLKAAVPLIEQAWKK